MQGRDRRSKRMRRLVPLFVGSALALGAGLLLAVAPAAADPVHVNAPATPGFADVVARVSPAVVSVRASSDATGDSEPPGFGGAGLGLPGDRPLKRLFREFMSRHGEHGEGLYDGMNPLAPSHAVAQGSGFFVSADGYVVTNSHVVDGGRSFLVITDDGKQYQARLIGSDRRTDLAVLKVDAKTPFTYVAFGDDAKMRVGDWVVAVGNPFGLGGTVAAGIISARGRDIGAAPYDDFIQIDAAVSRGNSGGPAFNLNGEVIGVDTAIFAPSGGNVGISFAIPASTAKGVVDQLIAHGEVSRGWIGVQVQSVTGDIADSLGIAGKTGAIIGRTDPNGPAQKAGIAVGDVITAVNGTAVANSRDLARRIAAVSPGKPVEVTLWRNGNARNLAVTVAEFPKPPSHGTPPTQPTPQGQAREDFGMKLLPTENGSGVLVTDVTPGSEAEDKGLQPGDIIMTVNNQPVNQASDVHQAALDAARLKRRAILLQVKSDAQTRFVALPIGNG